MGSAQPPGRVLVLGHRGFIGRHLFTHLQTAFPGCEILGRDVGEVNLARTGAEADLAPLFTAQTAVVVCSGIKKQNGDTLETFDENLRMVLTLCRALAAHPVRRLLYVSSAEVYGETPPGHPVNEQTPPSPATYYGMAKIASEGLLRQAGAPAGVDPLLLRLPFVYGPDDRPRIYGPAEFLRLASTGQPVRLWGDGTELREFLFVDDLARAVERLLPLDCGGALNVLSGRSASFREAADAVAAVLGRPIRIECRERSQPKVDNVFDARRLYALLPGFAFTPLAEGLARCRAAMLPEGP